MALRCAELDVVGLTTVAGNIGIETATHNAARILALAGHGRIPVVPGAAGPLARKGFDTADINGRDGLGGVDMPVPAVPPLSETAAEWIAGQLRAAPAGLIDILALGPLTNLARLTQDHPDAASKIGRIIAMGGAIDEPGNIGPRSEFNIAADPEAADIVLRSGIPVTLIPLDVTRRVRATREDTDTLRRSGGPAAVATADLIGAYFDAMAQKTAGSPSRPLHDPCVIIAALQPGLFGIDPMTIAVNLGMGLDVGALTRDGAGCRIDVAMRVDSSAAMALVMRRLTR